MTSSGRETWDVNILPIYRTATQRLSLALNVYIVKAEKLSFLPRCATCRILVP